MFINKPTEILFEKRADSASSATTVVITCYKYGKESLEALDSLLTQTEACFDIALIDDCSPDNSVDIIKPWFEKHADNAKFGNIRFTRHVTNQGLSQSRNTALYHVTTPYVFILDADNMIYPRCLELLREAIENSGYDMAYSLVETFGNSPGIICNSIWIAELFCQRNYIDAMALIKTETLQEIGGYRAMPFKFGWEDYDLWCSFVDKGLKGCHVPQILCRYRVHTASMLRSSTNRILVDNFNKIRADMESHHSFKFDFKI